jgi:hypothetical protein
LSRFPRLMVSNRPSKENFLKQRKTFSGWQNPLTKGGFITLPKRVLFTLWFFKISELLATPSSAAMIWSLFHITDTSMVGLIGGFIFDNLSRNEKWRSMFWNCRGPRTPPKTRWRKGAETLNLEEEHVDILLMRKSTPAKEASHISVMLCDIYLGSMLKIASVLWKQLRACSKCKQLRTHFEILLAYITCTGSTSRTNQNDKPRQREQLASKWATGNPIAVKGTLCC